MTIKILSVGNYISFIFLLLFLCCNTTPKDRPSQKRATLSEFDNYPMVKAFLNKKNVIENDSYYFITKSSDSTVRISWGNDSVMRIFSEDMSLPFAERLHQSWVNNDYLILGYGTGSGVWMNIVLPFNKTDEVQEFCNGLCFDTADNLFGGEQYDDTILVVYNLKTKNFSKIIITAYNMRGAARLTDKYILIIPTNDHKKEKRIMPMAPGNEHLFHSYIFPNSNPSYLNQDALKAFEMFFQL